MQIVKAYQNYMRLAYFAALRGVYDFDAEYEAYEAMAAVDVDKLVVMATSLRKSLRVKPSQVKFHKKGPKSYEAAVKKHNDAKQDWCDEMFGTPEKRVAYFKANKTPIHLVKTTGKQGTKAKPEGTLVAHYSHKRPRKVETPFGGEADNQEVF